MDSYNILSIEANYIKKYKPFYNKGHEESIISNYAYVDVVNNYDSLSGSIRFRYTCSKHNADFKNRRMAERSLCTKINEYTLSKCWFLQITGVNSNTYDGKLYKNVDKSEPVDVDFYCNIFGADNLVTTLRK